MSIKQTLANIAQKLTAVALNVPKVFEAGKLAERAAFWNSFHNDLPENGDYRFAGAGWNINTFKPTQSMKPSSAASMFRRNRFNGDFVALCEQQDVSFDFSECTVMTYAFQEFSSTRLGVIDCRKAGNLAGIFGYLYNCHTIDLVKVSKDNTYGSTSFRAPVLVEIRFEGEIGNDVSFQYCTKLSRASFENIFYTLLIAAAIKVTFSKVAVDKAFETAPGANDGSTSQEWNDLVDTRPNATIVLA